MIIPLKIYNPGQPEEAKRPRPLLYLSSDDAAVCAVREDGSWLAILWYPSDDDGIIAIGSAKEFIEDAGYDTSWAEWDLEGRFVRWAE